MTRAQMVAKSHDGMFEKIESLGVVRWRARHGFGSNDFLDRFSSPGRAPNKIKVLDSLIRRLASYRKSLLHALQGRTDLAQSSEPVDLPRLVAPVHPCQRLA